MRRGVASLSWLNSCGQVAKMPSYQTAELPAVAAVVALAITPIATSADAVVRIEAAAAACCLLFATWLKEAWEVWTREPSPVARSRLESLLSVL